MNYLNIVLKGTQNKEHIIRAEAARLLGEIGNKKAIPYLVNMLKTDQWYSKVTAVYSLEKIGDKKALPVLRAISKDPLVFDFSGMYNHDMIRIAATVALLKMGDKKAVENIMDLINIGTSQGFLELSRYILELPESNYNFRLRHVVTFEFVSQYFKQFRRGLHVRALDALPYFKTKQSLNIIIECTQDFSRYVRAKAGEALLRYADSRENREILLNMLKVEKEIFTKIRLAVLLDFRNAGEIIKEGLQDGDYFIRATALDAIADLKLYEFSDEAIKYLTDESFYVKLCAIETLERLKYKKPSK